MSNTLVVERISSIISEELAKTKATNSFFTEFPESAKAEDFKWCVHLYHLSKHFGDLLKLRWERFPDVSHDVFETHYLEEKDHAEMLRKWMISIGLEDPELSHPNYETEHFISLQYRAVASMDENMSLLIINSTSEGFAHAVYCHAYDKLKKAGFTDLEYWEVHTEADEEHSDVYDYVSEMTEAELKEAEHQVRYTIHVLNEMLSSWF
ncbi:iron-containing redox enzyme family protein [Brevibacillus ruminantium]|uniref:Iron-containing redox enzyme family protein n=1 Tax=Brevibacillus ruminantium TaxID=2950604 RepID=A0ABY4WPS5_9BACL|nr:iron-containing redox enzyme family protein [Brevibacillus ruminantium]USG68087.1 iron-containing redox enzyme family protein [Brevibacillus ruminantium]